MKTKDFYFDLPETLIAQTPLKDRTKSRLLVLDKTTGKTEHKSFENIIDYFKKGDCLVLNNTKVLPARIFGKKETGATVEFLLLEKLEKENVWRCLVKPGKKAKPETEFVFGDGLFRGRVLSTDEGGTRQVEFIYEGIFEELLDQIGQMPLPPYIKEKLQEKERYQTVYAVHSGSSAAPTAGLHFTNDLLDSIKEKGVYIAYVTLHVGLGTFRPVKSETLADHEMHSEYYVLDDENAEIIKNAKINGGEIISVGTTSTRTLESIMRDMGEIKATSGWTDIFIYPGYEFKIIDTLITNFHLPESTLIMLVSAFSTREIVLKAYEEAVKEKYRFFSFGDAMLIK
ncbi:MAG: tRNA preQ1(34) S-adenosylmethionine ribosyltransferase-isomerase QueA [Clostridiales bacterium]|nr:tRNA preQ1(34) S-adenosylmethionine ribosyltransferase-isomerase QueA [Clostridiales bacterium]